MPTIHTIDLNYLGVPETIASYLIVGPEGPVLIETGPESSSRNLTEGLNRLGYEPKDIAHALVTHIHLDHAGAAGWLAEHGTTIHVHEFGAKHLIDPNKLINSATRIYGDQMDRLWGKIIPVPEERVRAVRDGETISVGGLTFTAIETPGHARHHHAFALETARGRICFTGDAAAMLVPGIPTDRYVSIPTPPPEFDLIAWLRSIDRLDDARFKTLYPTHFGPVHTAAGHFVTLRRMLRSHVEFIRTMRRTTSDESELVRKYAIWTRRQAVNAGVSEAQIPHFVSDNLLRMNVTGIVRYLSQREAN